MIVTVAITSIVWIGVTMLTQPEPKEKLSALIYGSLFGIGKLIFKEWAAGSLYLVVAIVAGVLISRNLSRAEFEVETAKLEPAEEAV